MGTLFNQQLSICDFSSVVRCPTSGPTSGATWRPEATQRTTSTVASSRREKPPTERPSTSSSGLIWGERITSTPLPAGIEQEEVNDPRVIESTLQGGFKEELSEISPLEDTRPSEVEPISIQHQVEIEKEDQPSVVRVLQDSVSSPEENLQQDLPVATVQAAEDVEASSQDTRQPKLVNGAVQFDNVQLFFQDDLQQHQPGGQVAANVEPSSEDTFLPMFTDEPIQLGEIHIPDDLEPKFSKDNVQQHPPADEFEIPSELEPPFEDTSRPELTNGAVQLAEIHIPDDLELPSADNLQLNQSNDDVEVPNDREPSFGDTFPPSFTNGAVQLGDVQIPDDLELFSRDDLQQSRLNGQSEVFTNVEPSSESTFPPRFTNGAVQLGEIQVPDDLELLSRDDLQQSQANVEVKDANDVEPSGADTFQPEVRNREPQFDQIQVPVEVVPPSEDTFRPQFMKEQDLLAIIKILKDMEPSPENGFPSIFTKEQEEMTTTIPESAEPLSDEQFQVQTVEFPEDPEFSTQANLATDGEIQIPQEDSSGDIFQSQITTEEDFLAATEATENVEATVQPHPTMKTIQITPQQIYELDSIQFVIKSPAEIVDVQTINSSNAPNSLVEKLIVHPISVKLADTAPAGNKNPT